MHIKRNLLNGLLFLTILVSPLETWHFYFLCPSSCNSVCFPSAHIFITNYSLVTALPVNERFESFTQYVTLPSATSNTA